MNDIDRLNQKLEDMKLELKSQKEALCEVLEDYNKRIAVLEDRLSPCEILEDLSVDVREVRHTYKFISLEMHTHSKLSPFVSICYLDENGNPGQKFYASYDFTTLNDFLKNFFLTPDHIAE